MQEVRNNLGKLVCLIDKQNKVVEIVVKGCVTTIRFTSDGKAQILNSDKKI